MASDVSNILHSKSCGCRIELTRRTHSEEGRNRRELGRPWNEGPRRVENHAADRNDAHEEGLGCGIIGSISNGSRTGRTKTSRLDYVCPVHVRTAHSRSGRVLVHNGRRRFCSVESQTYLHTGEQEIQVEYTTETKEIQTTEEQQSEPSAGSTAKAAGAPNKISTVSTAQAASAPSSSSSVVTTSTPASVVPDGLRPRTQAPVTLPPTGPPDWVWIIGNGIRYHRASCGMVRVQSRRTRHLLRSDAIRSGYTACQQCGG